MRSLIGFLVLVTVLLVAAAIAVPALLRPVVASAVRAASPFGEQPLDVEVGLDAFGLIRGVVNEVRVTGSGLHRDDVAIAGLDVTASEVSIGDHTVRQVRGSLEGVDLVLGDGQTLRVGSIELAGPSGAIDARVRFDAAQALAFVRHAFDEQGVTVGDIQLTAAGVSFVIFEQRVTVPLGVDNGALVVPDMLGNGPLALLAPQEGDPWRLTGVSVSADGMELDATVDGDRMLRGAQVTGGG